MNSNENISIDKIEQISSLLKRADMFLEDMEWDRATEYGEKVLDIDPENAHAYLCKMLAELKIKTKAQLANSTVLFDSNKNYEKIMRFADESLKTEIADALATVKTSIAEKERESIYQSAKKLASCFSDIQKLKKASTMFMSIEDYKDSAKLSQQCHETIDAINEKKKIDQDKARERREAYNAYLAKYPLVAQIDELAKKRSELANKEFPPKAIKIALYIFSALFVTFLGLGTYLTILQYGTLSISNFIKAAYSAGAIVVVAEVFLLLVFIGVILLRVYFHFQKVSVRKQIKAIDDTLEEIKKIPPFEG